MEVVGAIVASVVNYLCTCMSTPLEEQCKHLKNPTEEIVTLRSKKAELIARGNDIESILQIAKEQGKTRTNEAQDWLKKVDGVIHQVNDVENKATVARRYMNGVLPNCCSRLNLARDITKLIKEVTCLLEKAEVFSEENRIAFHVPDVGLEMPITRLIGKTTAEKNLELVWECLMDDETRTIGVYGMGGVGKTTMMKEINNRLLDKKHCFDKIFWVTVSKDGNVHKLQGDIAEQVGLTLSPEQDETRRSPLLLKALVARRRILLILDDMWESFSLHEIGIPDFSEHNGSKLVVTTRSLEVCRRMGCKIHILVELLSEDEAWELFYRTVDVRLDEQVEKIAKDVTKECSRLPLAIVTVGGVMRGINDIREWRVSLTDLQHSKNCSLNMEEQVIERLKFSYNRLGNEVLKNCFLYIAMWPEDSSMREEELIEHWAREGLINEKSIANESDRGHTLLKKLKKCCLLEYDEGKKKM